MTNQPSAEKPTDQWVTGDEPMTGPRRSYLETLAREAGEAIPQEMTKAEASEAIERLQRVTGRGADSDGPTDESGGAATGNGDAGTTDGATAAGDDPSFHETLAERVEREGIVDQQASIVPDQEAG